MQELYTENKRLGWNVGTDMRPSCFSQDLKHNSVATCNDRGVLGERLAVCGRKKAVRIRLGVLLLLKYVPGRFKESTGTQARGADQSAAAPFPRTSSEQRLQFWRISIIVSEHLQPVLQSLMEAPTARHGWQILPRGSRFETPLVVVLQVPQSPLVASVLDRGR